MWEHAKKDSSTLRTVLSRRLVSVEEDFYDRYLTDVMRNYPHRENLYTRTVLDIFKETNLYLSYYFIKYRYACICHSY